MNKLFLLLLASVLAFSAACSKQTPMNEINYYATQTIAAQQVKTAIVDSTQVPSGTRGAPPQSAVPTQGTQRCNFQLNSNWPQEVQRYKEYWEAAANQNCVEPNILAAISFHFTGANPDYYQVIGEYEVVGLMPITVLPGRPTVEELKDPATSISWAATELGKWIKAGDPQDKEIYKKALIGYMSGGESEYEANAQKHLQEILDVLLQYTQ